MINNIYTDLALESHNIAVEKRGGEIPGVDVQETVEDNMKITRINVLNQQGAEALGRPIGSYITIESEGLKGQNRVVHDQISEGMARELASLIDFGSLTPDSTIFVVGLGNWNATPDALGPGMLNSLMVTRHLFREAPPELKEGMRSVCALAPGVLGLTGIQTAEIIKGVVDMIKPDLIIAVDSLAARNTARLAATIQLSNTGISPGSGLGKSRMGINQETMEVPVIAIGIPTVIYAATIISDALDDMMQGNMFSSVERERFRHIDENEKRRTIQHVLQPYLGELIVSPKGIDELIEDVGRIIAGAVNMALHPDITPQNLSLYL